MFWEISSTATKLKIHNVSSMQPVRLQYEILLKNEKEYNLSLLLHLGDVPSANKAGDGTDRKNVGIKIRIKQLTY